MRRLIAITVIVMMVLLLLPAWAFAENDGSSQQIGKYFDVSEKDGTISSPVPGLTGETVRSYENDKVKVNKTIFGTDTENVFDITLDVSVDETVTFDVQETSGDAAAVLVVDLSSSMTNTYRNSTKISAANYAIDAFVARFKEDMNGSTRYIAVVGFGGYSGNKDKKDGARTHWDWTQVTSDTAISDLSVKTSTGTNLEAGLILAKNLLGQKLYNGKNEEITNKSIILLSDGQPTYYVTGDEKNSTSTDVICENGSNMGGNGSDTEHDCHEPVETLMHSEGFKGIHKYAVYIGGRNDELDCTSNNCPDRRTGIQEWLGNECGFTTILADGAGNIDLGTVFENIATHITLEGTPGLVTDPMGQIIDIQTVTGYNISTPNPEATVNVADNILGWNLLKVTPAMSENDDNVKNYSLTYRVTLDNLDANFHEGVFYPTNGVTDLPYAIMENNQVNRTGIAYFNIPSVKGFTGNLTFKKVDEAGKGLEGAEFTLSHDKSSHHFTNNDDFSMTALSDSNGTVTFENIPSGHTYTLEETSAPAGYIKSVDVYTVEVNYGVVSVTKDGVPVVSNGGSFTVSNKRDVTSLTVKKEWNDGGYAGVTSPGSISVQLYADGIHYGDPVTLAGDSWSHTWNDLPRTNDGKVINYTVEETSGHLDYDAKYSAMDNGVITITNTYAPQHGKLKIVKIFAGDVESAPEGFDADFIVTGPANYKKTISWADFKDGHYVLEGLNEGDYTVEEELKSSTEGYEVAVMYKDNSPVPVAVSVHPLSEAYTEVTNTYYGIAPYDDDGDDDDDDDDDDHNDGGGGGHHHHHHDSGIIIPTFVPKSGDASVLGYGAMAAAAAMAVIFRRRK